MPKRGENIYKRKDGRWEGRYIKSRNNNGKPIYGYVYSKSYKETKRKLIEKKQSSNTISNDKCFNYYSDIWLLTKKHSIKPSSYSKYANMLNKHILPEFAKYKINEITQKDIDNFVKLKMNIQDSTTEEKSLSLRYIKDIVSIVCSVINSVGKDNKFSYNFDKWTGNKTKDIEILSRDEQMKLTNYLLKYIDNTNLGILLSLYTGIRIGELCALRFSNISFYDEMAYIDKTMQRIQTMDNSLTKTQVIITAPKTQKAVREIPIPHFICKVLKKIAPENKNSFLLSGAENYYIEPRTMQYRFKTIIEKCSLKNIKFHALRHTFATRCIEAGCDIKCLSEMLGHSNVNITLNRYVHSSLEHKKTNITKMLSVLNFTPS